MQDIFSRYIQNCYKAMLHSLLHTFYMLGSQTLVCHLDLHPIEGLIPSPGNR